MSLPEYAVTPCDTRQPRPASAHPANVASREHSAQVLNLALEIADVEAQGLVESYSHEIELDGEGWYHTLQPPPDMRRHADDRDLALSTVARAVRYIDLRSPDAFRLRLVRHPENPALVRFERKS